MKNYEDLSVSYLHYPLLQSRVLMTLRKGAFENTEGKGEDACNTVPFSSNKKLLSAKLLVWKSLNFFVWEEVHSFPNHKNEPVQFQTICRPKHKCDKKIMISLGSVKRTL